MSDARTLLTTYLAQQRDLGTPALVLSGTQQRDALLSECSGRPVTFALPPAPTKTAAPARPPTRSSMAPQSLAVPRPGSVPLPAVSSATTVPAGDARTQLVALYTATKGCTQCALSRTRRVVVFGSGNVNASLLIVGDAPDFDDDAAGKPFTGAAGQLLTKMLSAIKLDRDKDAFLTTMVKCRPSEDRTPEAVEIHTCRSILMRQIQIMKPRLILLLGRVAAHALIETSENVSVLRTRAHQIGAIPAVVTYHPAALLRDETLKRPAWEDLQKLQALLGELNAAGR